MRITWGPKRPGRLRARFSVNRNCRSVHDRPVHISLDSSQPSKWLLRLQASAYLFAPTIRDHYIVPNSSPDPDFVYEEHSIGDWNAARSGVDCVHLYPLCVSWRVFELVGDAKCILLHGT